MSNNLDLQCSSVSPDLCPSCLQRLSAQMIKVTASNERVNYVLLSADASACIISMKVFRILRLTFYRKSASKS